MKTANLSCLKFIIIPISVLSVPTVRALTITPIYDTSFTNLPNFLALQNTVNNAVATYAQFPGSLVIPVKFEFSSTIGGAQSSYSAGSYSFTTYRNALILNASSATDATVLANIGLGPNDPVLNRSNFQSRKLWLILWASRQRR